MAPSGLYARLCHAFLVLNEFLHIAKRHYSNLILLLQKQAYDTVAKSTFKVFNSCMTVEVNENHEK